jgi:hypothetical protein
MFSDVSKGNRIQQETSRKGRVQYYFSAGNTGFLQIQGNHTVSPLITEKAVFVMFSVG